jgi:hypothetical protein
LLVELAVSVIPPERRSDTWTNDVSEREVTACDAPISSAARTPFERAVVTVGSRSAVMVDISP